MSIKANAFSVQLVLFSNMDFAQEDVELIKFISIEFVSAVAVSQEEEKIVYLTQDHHV